MPPMKMSRQACILTLLVLAETNPTDSLDFQNQRHTSWKSWCNDSLPHQVERRAALQLLLERSEHTPSTEQQLQVENRELADIGVSLEQQRVVAAVTQAEKVQRVANARLDLNLAGNDVEALQRALKLASSKGTKGVDALKGMLADAESAKQKQEHVIRELEASYNELVEGNLSILEESYKLKKHRVVQLQHQLFTTERSLGLLTAALEEESEYLAEMHGMCGAEQRVQKRVVDLEHVFVSSSQVKASVPRAVAPSTSEETSAMSLKPKDPASIETFAHTQATCCACSQEFDVHCG